MGGMSFLEPLAMMKFPDHINVASIANAAPTRTLF